MMIQLDQLLNKQAGLTKTLNDVHAVTLVTMPVGPGTIYSLMPRKRSHRGR